MIATRQQQRHNSAQNGPHRKTNWPDIVLLAGGGLYFAQLIYSGDLANYVNPRFAWIAWFGMAAFIGLALAKALPAEHAHSHGCCQQQPRWKLWLLALPLAIGFLLPSQPLNSSVIQSRKPDVQSMLREEVGMQYLITPETIAYREQLYSFYNEIMPDKRKPLDSPLALTLLDWFRIAFDLPEEKKNLLEGMPVDLIGFVYHPGQERDRFMLTRFFMRHCMFDTVPLGLPVSWPNGDSLAEDSWVRVQGRMRYLTDHSGKAVLTVVGQSVKLTEQPETPYLYPEIAQ